MRSMTAWTPVVRTEFLNAGWQELIRSAVTEGWLHGLFVGGFAVCGVRIAQSSAEVTEVWPELQALMGELKTEERKDQERDYYLIFVVNRVDDTSLAALQRMLDDTRICRKICLELRGRTLGDTFRDDVPFFSTPGTKSDVGEAFTEDSPLAGIPDTVQRDLELKSAERILDSLIGGEYEVN
jgi:hypothetical protein